MFANQSEERDNYIKLAYPILYKQWLLDNNKTPSKAANFYMDGEFFQWVISKYKHLGIHKNEACELIDLLIRKNMTSKNFIGYDNEIRHEMYGVAMDKIFKYTIAGYDDTKGTAFVFFTSAITNAFKEVLKDYYKTRKIVKRLLTVRQTDAVAYNYESADIAEIESQIKKSLVYFEDDEISEIKRVWNDFYTTLNQTYQMKRLKLLVDKNTPKFKRQYITYDHFIAINDNHMPRIEHLQKLMNDAMGIEDELYEEYQNEIDTLTASIKSGIVVEFYDTRTTNESNGTRPSELKTRALVARRNGYQYFAVFSDQWEIGKDMLLQKLSEMKEYVEFNHDKSTGRELQWDYITNVDLSDDNIQEPFYWGLKEERASRVVIPQNINDYINWLDTEENATRVYSFGRLKSL